MEVSKLHINPDHLRFQPLSRNKKADLRRKNVLELIRSKPNGQPITLAEFQRACAFTTTAGAYGLIKTMLDRGTIVRQVEGLNRHSYYVAADAVKLRDPKPAAEAQPDQLVSAGPPVTGSLLDLAKEFAWLQNSDSLREFVKWVGPKL